jgi:hypothetical protein
METTGFQTCVLRSSARDFSGKENKDMSDARHAHKLRSKQQREYSGPNQTIRFWCRNFYKMVQPARLGPVLVQALKSEDQGQLAVPAARHR